MKQNNEKKTLIYCRESRDEYGENYERIETQRDLLIKYCNVHGYTNIVDIIMDDDKSGTDFYRFKDICEKVKKREIDVIVFKNSARLGRNQKEALNFVEFLEEYGVEIIFEDEQYNEEIFGLYAWFNERRARDDSKNIRRNLRHKIEEGKLLIKAIYGYNKEGNKLVINNDTSRVVKKIFELYACNWGCNNIARYLNNKKILTPSQSRNFINSKKTTSWNSQHILRIINDRRYVGDYIGGYTEKVSFKSKKTRVKNKNEWVIINNHHEAIIERELFDIVQELRKKRSKNRFEKSIFEVKKEDKDNKYSGIISCGKCGMLMYKRNGSNKRPNSYICKKYSKEGKERIKDEISYGCTSHRIRYEYIDKIINQYVINLIDNDMFKKFVIDNIESIDMDVKTIEKELIQNTETIKRLYARYKQIYEDKLNKVIPDIIFSEKKQELDEKIRREELLISELKDKIKKIKEEKEIKKIVFDEIENIKNNGLYKYELISLFKSIIYFEKNEITNKEKDLYYINDMMYNELYKNGGLIVCLNFMYQ